MSRLSGKVAVVTGASKGIGAAIAKEYAAEGAKVVVNYARSKKEAEAVVASITAAGGSAIAVQGDIATRADVERLFAETDKAFGAVDILVNNAGIYKLAPLEQIDDENFHSQFNLNVLGLLYATQEAVKRFGTRGGTVLNISSVVAHSPFGGGSVYSATKAAVDAITIALSQELGPKGIRVNSINPGMIVTEGAKDAGIIGSDFEKEIVARTPLGRVGQPEDIAKAAVFFATAESGWATGQTFTLAGGMR